MEYRYAPGLYDFQLPKMEIIHWGERFAQDMFLRYVKKRCFSPQTEQQQKRIGRILFNRKLVRNNGYELSAAIWRRQNSTFCWKIYSGCKINPHLQLKMGAMGAKQQGVICQTSQQCIQFSQPEVISENPALKSRQHITWCKWWIHFSLEFTYFLLPFGRTECIFHPCPYWPTF